jgi:hypothetical protein
MFVAVENDRTKVPLSLKLLRYGVVGETRYSGS